MSSETRTPYRIAYIQSSWHADIVEQAGIGFAEVADASAATVERFAVPGAFELPLHARLLCETGRFDAIAVVGFVVDGGIYRHDFVSQAVIDGLMRVQLDTGIPVFSGVLTPLQFHEHDAHQAFFFDHMATKGRELAQALLTTLDARAAVLASS